MEFALIIVGITGYLFLNARISSLQDQVTSLKQQIESSVQNTPDSSAAPAPENAYEMKEQAPKSFGERVERQIVRQQSTAFTPQTVASTPSPFIAWLREDLFMKLGALLLLIAFGWFVSYAFMNNWIGPMGRIALGLLMGAAFMALGIWRIQTFLHQGSIFTVLGSTTVLLTIFAAREIYDFFTPALALGCMFLSVVFVAFVAVRYRHQNLALAGLLLGAIAPLLTNSDPNVVAMFSYLLVLVLGSLWVVYLIDATILPLSAFLVVAFYGVPYLIGIMSDADSSLALLFAFVFTIIFFISNIVSILKRTDDNSRAAHLFLALGTGLYLTAWIAFAVDEEWRSLMNVAWAIAFAFGAFVVYLRTADRIPFYIYSAVSIGLLAIATAAELEGPVLTIAYTVEITALLVAASQIFKDYALLNRISALFLGPVVLSFGHIMSRNWNDGFLHADFFALSILMFCMWVSAIVIFGRRTEERVDEVDAVSTLSIAGGIYAVILCWLVTHAIFPEDMATTASLFIYTVSGISMYVLGQTQEKQMLRILGGTLVGLVIGRLFLVDVWAMALAGRIVTFFVVGILLISTAFITKMKKNHDTM